MFLNVQVLYSVDVVTFVYCRVCFINTLDVDCPSGSMDIWIYG